MFLIVRPGSSPKRTLALNNARLKLVIRVSGVAWCLSSYFILMRRLIQVEELVHKPDTRVFRISRNRWPTFTHSHKVVSREAVTSLQICPLHLAL